MFSQDNPNVGFSAGSQGVWKTTDSGDTFASLNAGLPDSPYYRKINSIVLSEDGAPRLFAATHAGLFSRGFDDERWRRIPVDPDADGESEEVLKILRVRDDLLAFTDSHAYRASLAAPSPVFEKIPLPRATDTAPPEFLVKLFFNLHNGEIWGLTGRLLFDTAGIVLLFLSISAFYIWYFPWKLKRKLRASAVVGETQKSATYRFLFKYHLKIGIWVAAILLIIGGTGVFMRPPLIAILGLSTVPRDAYPGPLPDNPWRERIRSALYDAVEDRVIIESLDGFWAGKPDFSGEFHKIDFPASVFVMGTNVFEPYGDDGFLVGSFAGLFHIERQSGRVIDLRTGLDAGDVFIFKPADVMASGYMRTPDGREYMAAHHEGLIPLGDTPDDGRFQMPAEIARDYRMPLWNFLFELHNGRIFKDIVGPWFALIAPLGSILFVFMTLTGAYDWCYLRLRKNGAPSSAP